jgi:antitoxin component YwqK of YwqJK toxin-antitoxin module
MRQSEGEYLDGKKHGVWISYSDTGLEQKKEMFRDGELTPLATN